MHSACKLKQQHADRIELVQLTDTHIFPDPAGKFDHIDTAETLQAVINHMKLNHWPRDGVLVTGDLVHDPVPAAYQRLSGMLDKLAVPVFCLPGNHDDPRVMYQYLRGKHIDTGKLVILDNWLIILLDSWLPNSHAGELSQDELDWLESTLTNNNHRHVLICLHHPPVSVNSPWMDRMGLLNPDALFEILDKDSHVRAVLWGHIHQEFNAVHGHIRLMATPSTCVQFTPGSTAYVRDNRQPGYRQLVLFQSGHIESTVIRIESLITR